MKTMIDDGGAAFPVPFGRDPDQPSVNGMTVRQYYKAAMLTGWAAGRNNGDVRDPSNSTVEMVASACGKYADAMLAERDETNVE